MTFTMIEDSWNHKTGNYVKLGKTLVKNDSKMGSRCTFDVHLDKFKENIQTYPEEQGKCFRQDILDLECHYQRGYNENMMGD